MRAEFSEIRKAVAATRPSAGPKSEKIAHEQDAETRETAAAAPIETVVERIAALGLTMNKVLGQLSDQLVEEVERHATLRHAVDLERRELERPHRLDVAATALDQLVQDYEQKKHARRNGKDAHKKQRSREAEDCEYKKMLERKKAQDACDEQQELQNGRTARSRKALGKSRKVRDVAPKSQEKEEVGFVVGDKYFAIP